MVLLETLKLLHVIGLAWGVGGATVTALLFRKTEQDKSLAPAIMKFMPMISKLIWAAIILLVISGIGLAQFNDHAPDPTIFSVKMVVVALMIINGIHLSFRLLPKLQALFPANGAPSDAFLKAKQNLKIASTIGLVLWYLIVILAVAM